MDMFSKDGKVTKNITAGDSARDLKNWNEAARHYSQALKGDATNAPIWVQLGHAQKESGLLKDALESYQNALGLDSSNSDTYLQIGHLYKMIGLADEAQVAYLHSHALAVSSGEPSNFARKELELQGLSLSEIRERLVGLGFGRAGVHIAFELSDLVDFLQNARFPTGIQRVQLSMAKSIMAGSLFEDVTFVYYDHGRYDWVEVAASDMDALIELTTNDKRPEEQREKKAAEIKSRILSAVSIVFPKHTVLLNTGTSWGYWNYFSSIRKIKKEQSCFYVPLVHDCIPILFPEFCNQELVKDFINWLTGVRTHADLILVNSDNTGRDAAAFFEKIGGLNVPIVTTRINGDFEKVPSKSRSLKSVAARELLEEKGLYKSPFVLFVATIEPRKGHTLVLDVWSRLLKESDDSEFEVPKLVLVGNSGWMNEGIYNQIDRDPLLKTHVTVMHNLPDSALTTLYESCQFTLFPSSYEGWGLPITEAIYYGKVPLVSNVSSHPEAGGEHAVYFEAGNRKDFYEKVRSLLSEPSVLKEMESKIAVAKPTRPWGDIFSEMSSAIKSSVLDREPESDKFTEAPEIEAGKFYSFARNTSVTLRDRPRSGDVMRSGVTWHPPEDWGCWSLNTVGQIWFSWKSFKSNAIKIYLELTGSAIDNEVEVSVIGNKVRRLYPLPKANSLWVCLDIKRSIRSEDDIQLVLRGTAIDDFAENTEGRDTRKSSFGIKTLFVCDASNVEHRVYALETINYGDLLIETRV